MKWLKIPAVILFLIAALAFAYTRFESSFNPRRGQVSSGPPPMPAMAARMMAQHNGKAAAKQIDSNKPKAKETPHTSSHSGDTDKQTSPKGGD
jgi:hypothetical protein